MAIYSKKSNLNNGVIGKLETPIKMIIEHESDLMKKKGGICDLLFNQERSNHFGETIIIQNDFADFKPVTEGAAAPEDSIEEKYSKFIEHIQFMKEFVITAEMMEDANYGIAAEAEARIRNFVRAYYKTRNKICETMLANGVEGSVNFSGKGLDITTPDDNPLFAFDHRYGGKENYYTQSNYFYGNIFTSEETGNKSAGTFEEALTELSVKLRNMRDENGEPLGYVADTLILPGNRPQAEAIAKKVCGSYGTTGSANNDINLNYGNWNIVVLPGWSANKDQLIVMSSEANKNLRGNIFFDRIPLTITNWVDHHTGNYIWNGRCRFGVGFGSYKHMLLAVDSDSEIEYCTPL